MPKKSASVFNNKDDNRAMGAYGKSYKDLTPQQKLMLLVSPTAPGYTPSSGVDMLKRGLSAASIATAGVPALSYLFDAAGATGDAYTSFRHKQAGDEKLSNIDALEAGVGFLPILKQAKTLKGMKYSPLGKLVKGSKTIGDVTNLLGYSNGGLFDTDKKAFVDSTLAANKGLDFVKRMFEENTPTMQVPGQQYPSTHLMEYDPKSRRVYPSVVRNKGKLQHMATGDASYNYADSTGEFIEFPTSEQAAWFSTNGYKQGTGVLKKMSAGGVQDYLASKSQASDFEARKVIAKKMGITNYTVTAQQNQTMQANLKQDKKAAFEPINSSKLSGLLPFIKASNTEDSAAMKKINPNDIKPSNGDTPGFNPIMYNRYIPTERRAEVKQAVTKSSIPVKELKKLGYNGKDPQRDKFVRDSILNKTNSIISEGADAFRSALPLPKNVTQMLAKSVLGDSRMTNKSLSDKEKVILWETIENAKKRSGVATGGGTEYEDYQGKYGTKEDFNKAWNEGSLPEVLSSVQNPAQKLASTIGRGRYWSDPETGNVTYTDVYDWNKKEKNFDPEKANIYQKVRNHFRSTEDPNLDLSANNKNRMNFVLNPKEIAEIKAREATTLNKPMAETNKENAGKRGFTFADGGSPTDPWNVGDFAHSVNYGAKPLPEATGIPHPEDMFKGTNEFTPNGSRLYPDRGFKTTTREPDLLGASAMVTGLARFANAFEPSENDLYKKAINRGTTDSQFNTYTPTNKRGFIDPNSGRTAPDQQVPVQFANDPYAEYYGAMPIAAEGMGIPDALSVSSSMAEYNPRFVPNDVQPVNTSPSFSVPLSKEEPGSHVTVTPNDKVSINKRTQTAYNHYLAKGLPAHVAAGIVGNLYRESGLKTDINEKGGTGNGRGIAQWDVRDRWQGLLSYAGKSKRDPYALETQLDYVIDEPGEGAKVMKKLMGTKTAEEAAMVFGRVYERPKEGPTARWDIRTGIAKKLFTNMMNRGDVASNRSGFQEGGTYEMNERDLAQFLKNGGEVEFI